MNQRLSHALRRRIWPIAKLALQTLHSPRHRSSTQLTLFVTGVQRSGTNMVMEIYERSLRTQVFHEADSRAFDDYQQRDQATLERLVRNSPASVVVIKALLEAHRIRQLLDNFAPAKAVWMYRHFDDTIKSMLTRWPGDRNFLDRIVKNRSSGEWRALGMTDETYAIVRRCYSRTMSDAAAQALYYYYRHQLFYDQGLDRDPRVLLMSYEDLTSSAIENVKAIAEFSNLPFKAAMQRHVHKFFKSGSDAPCLPPEICHLVMQMYEKLQTTRLVRS